jgi:hypothetical protein
VRVGRLGDVDDDELAAADAAALDPAGARARLVEVVADEDEAADRAVLDALAERHRLVLEDRVGEATDDLGVARVRDVHDGDLIQARHVEVRGRAREHPGDRDGPRVLVDEADVGTRYDRRALCVGLLARAPEEREEARQGGERREDGDGACRHAHDSFNAPLVRSLRRPPPFIHCRACRPPVAVAVRA